MLQLRRPRLLRSRSSLLFKYLFLCAGEFQDSAFGFPLLVPSHYLLPGLVFFYHSNQKLLGSTVSCGLPLRSLAFSCVRMVFVV